MKKTTKSKLYFILQLIFYMIVPCVLIWVQYGQTEVAWYKISVTGIVLLLIVFLIFKKLFLNPLIKKVNDQLSQIEIDQLSVTDQTAIQSLKKRFRRLAVIQLIFNAVIPVAVLALGLLTINVVEAGLIKLHNVLMLCTVSIAIGLICKIGEIYALKCEHEVSNE